MEIYIGLMFLMVVVNVLGSYIWLFMLVIIHVCERTFLKRGTRQSLLENKNTQHPEVRNARADKFVPSLPKMAERINKQHLGRNLKKTTRFCQEPAGKTKTSLFPFIHFSWNDFVHQHVTFSRAGVVIYIPISYIYHDYCKAKPILELVVCGRPSKEISTLWYRELL